jgi:predicted nucleic acid-binding protein
VILIDSGPLVAAAVADDQLHERCADALLRAEAPRLVVGPVIAEVSYLLAREAGPGAEAPFLRSFETGFLTLADLEPGDLTRAADLVEQYADLPLDATDACTIAVAERLGVTEIATIDNDFRVVRPRHVEVFAIVPEGV